MKNRLLTKNQFILLSSILIGLLVGFASIILKTFLHFIYKFVSLEPIENLKYIYIALPIVGLFLTVLLVKVVLKGKYEKGLSLVHLAIAKKSSVIPSEHLYSQILTSSLTVGFGGSAGIEAPIVITGAAFGSNYSKFYHLNYKERTLLLACGIAAGIGATFNAPIAGVLFSLEILLLDLSIAAFTPLIIAAATGALISKIILQDDILLSFQIGLEFDYRNVPFYILLGIFTGLISVYHSRIFAKIEGLFSRTEDKIYQNIMIGGVALSILIFIFPSLFGEGFQSIKMLAMQAPHKLLENGLFHDFQNNEWFVLAFIGILVFVKAIATALTIGAGGNGGNFAPSLFVGAYAGFFFSKCLNMTIFTKLPTINFTVVGMAGILSGIYHAPLTAIFLIAEITGGYTLMIPLMIVASLSYAISKYFEPYSMDTKQLALAGKMITHDRDHNVLANLDTTNLIETDFQQVSPDETLGKLVGVISKSRRNIFPVIDKENKLLGIIIFDNIRDIIFKNEMYEILTIKELMSSPPAIISSSESMEIVMKKFDETGAWNLPVIDNADQYVGFISKSSVISSYRNKLKATSID